MCKIGAAGTSQRKREDLAATVQCQGGFGRQLPTTNEVLLLFFLALANGGVSLGPEREEVGRTLRTAAGFGG